MQSGRLDCACMVQVHHTSGSPLEASVSEQSYTTSFTVDRRPDEAFNAINNVRDWWEDTIAGPTHEVGDEFTHWVPGVHYARIRVTELVRGTTVVWRVLDNWMGFIGDQREWKGTEIRFDISTRDGMTEVRFTHVGLVPQYECFEVCQDARPTRRPRSYERASPSGRPAARAREGAERSTVSSTRRSDRVEHVTE